MYADVAISLVLVLLAMVVSRVEKLGLESELAIATARALVQLTIVAGVIGLVFKHVGATAAFLCVMLLAAAWTSGRRLKGVPDRFLIAGIAIAVATGIAISILFGLRVFPFTPRYLIPITGMVIGNAMGAVSVAGLRLRNEIVGRTLEVEARLALGVRASDSLKPYTRRSAATALIPTIDATKNVGLIHLPGAFVGMILGGASPSAAAQVQLVVLFMLLGAISVAGMTSTILVGRSFIGEGERIVIPPALIE
jgi:putative ABC transport system permease protein